MGKAKKYVIMGVVAIVAIVAVKKFAPNAAAKLGL